MRTISDKFLDAIFSEETEEIAVLLVRFQHPDLLEDILISSDNKNLLDWEEQLRGTISRGEEYSFVAMGISLPEEGDTATPTISLTIYDIDLDLIPLLRNVTTQAYVTVELVLASVPNAPEISFDAFMLTSAEVESTNIVLSLTVDALGQEPYPADNFTPSTFGGLWSTT